MSYSIVKSIKIVDDKVFLHSTPNNVRPYDWETWECSYLSTILQNQGKEALDKEILILYWEGNFQRSNNNYQKAVNTFDRSVYNWDYISQYSAELSKLGNDAAIIESKKRKEEVREKLYEHYQAFISCKKEKWIVKYLNYYLFKVTSRKFRFSPDARDAKIFTSRKLAEYAIQYAENKDQYTFHQLA